MSFSAIHRFFDDVEVGEEFESHGRTVTETDIVNFAGLSGDYNPIHMDHEFAKSTPFRRPIAHGLLTFSIGSGLAVMSPPMRTIAFIRVDVWNFVGPVFIGDTVQMKSKVLKKELRGRGRRGEIHWHRRIVNQEGKTVQEGTLVTMVESRLVLRPSPAATAEAVSPVAG